MAFVELDVSDHPFAKPRLGYLLLRDGHAVPLRGISPDELKAGAKHRVPYPEAEPLKHRRCLDAIVDRLGFRGDFGTFQHEGWSEFQRFLERNRCTGHVGVFPMDHGGCIDLYFGGSSGPQPRQLADRTFEAQLPVPRRVFLGYGVNWAAWDCGNGVDAPADAVNSIIDDQATAGRRARELFARRHDLAGQWGFLDDKLIDGPIRHVVDKSYWTQGSDQEERSASEAKVGAAARAFRAVFDSQRRGWVDVLRFNDRLVILRAHDGSWDLLWRCYRDKEPPSPSLVASAHGLAVEDLPSRLMTESDVRRAVHFRQEVWDESEGHAAEQAYYDRGGSKAARQTTSDADVRVAWLREQDKLLVRDRAKVEEAPPAGFCKVLVNGRRLAFGDIVDVGSFRRMLVETGYDDRRPPKSESWTRANEGDPDQVPVGASWADAQAYCAWMERKLGVALRLPTRNELRALRPAQSTHYEKLAKRDFPWEHYPPRPMSGSDHALTHDVPSAVAWSEPRFLSPAHDVPEHPMSAGFSPKSRKRWIKDFPPRATWKEQLPWAQHAGLAFIDAWDAYEWCQESGWISGRFWEGHIAANSWGAYKNVKVTFRLVIDLEG